MKRAYDRQKNPAAWIKVMPCYRGQALPVAVFVKYADTPYCWQQYSREYQYPKCAHKAARLLEIEHFAYQNLEDDAFYKRPAEV